MPAASLGGGTDRVPPKTGEMKRGELEKQLMFQANEILWQKGAITEEMYIRAKEGILSR